LGEIIINPSPPLLTKGRRFYFSFYFPSFLRRGKWRLLLIPPILPLIRGGVFYPSFLKRGRGRSVILFFLLFRFHIVSISDSSSIFSP